MHSNKIIITKSLFMPFLAMLFLIFLRWQYGVMLFHTLAELFCIMISMLMLVVVWNTRDFTRNDFLLYLGIGYFWVAVLDTWHAFTLSGMPFFDISNEETALHFWIYARFIEALILLSAPLFFKRHLNANLMFYLGAGLSVIVIWASLNLQQPIMLTSEGLTLFKIVSEYFVMILLCLSAFVYIIQRRLFAERVLYYLLTSISLTVIAEFFFTQYTDFYGVPFTIGHLFKFLSFWMIYQAIILTTLKEPFSVMAQTSNSYDAMPHAAVVVDNQGMICQLNRQAINLAGFSEETLVHTNVHKYFHPHKIPVKYCKLCLHIQKGQALDSEVVYFPEKNQWSVISLAPLTAGNRNSGMVQSSIDITAQKIASQKLIQTENLFKTVINATPDWISIKDKEFRYSFVNIGYAEALSMQPNEFYGKTDDDIGFSRDLIYGDEAKGIRGFRMDDIDVLNGMTLHNPYDPATFSDGSLHIFDTYKAPLLDSSGMIYAVLGISRDVTERLDLEIKLHQAATVYDSTNEGILITDAEANIIAVNTAFSFITGYSEEDVLGKNPRMLASGKHDEIFYKALWKKLLSTGRWQGEMINRHKKGYFYPAWKTISTIKNEDGKTINYVSTFSDISELKKSEENLKYMAQHDQLTQLPNRILLSYQLEQAIFRAKRNKNIIAILFLDLDDFKQINDTLGHSIGDKVLISVAQKFKACVREEDILARQGGDEFLIVLEELHSGQEASITAQKLINSLSNPISIHEHNFRVGVSIGISLFPDDGLESEQLIKNADFAMYESKKNKKNTYSFFTPQLNQLTLRRTTLETCLKEALTNNEIYVVYQPQIDLTSHQVYGFEALIRWKHQKLGNVPPIEFIPIAESMGLINDLGKFVLQNSIRQIQSWNEKFATKLRISVNLSARQFEDVKLPELINSLLIENNCAPEYLELDITEFLILQENSQILKSLTEISKANISIALDNFGTGYSSLAYLKKFPINRVKIDQSFIRDIIKNNDGVVFVKTIISMANNLGMEAVAEGVETAEQSQILDEEGCHLVQGYYYSQALKEDEVEAFLLNWKY